VADMKVLRVLPSVLRGGGVEQSIVALAPVPIGRGAEGPTLPSRSPGSATAREGE
jgi:hypothetical protein